ncbi:hypothetical protein [Hippea sp. KM1]|uniref:hypothetical protein n=1 Tax=Hippea sp. KM1 TaxID=944481 RepID=UPI00046CA904|nr:hypothetical protein [Hippea sp. KM1]
MDLNLRCGIAIGKNRIDACILKKKGRDYSIESLFFYDFANEGELEDIFNALSDYIPKEILANVSFKHQSIIEHIYFYNNNTESKSNIYKDLKRDYEIELKDYIIDYEEHQIKDKTVAYVVALPKSLFNFYYGMLEKQKKLKLYSFETHSVSIRRAANEFLEGDYLLGCAIFKDYSVISACSQGKVLALRNLRYSWSELINSLCNAGGITQEEAERLIREKGLEEPDDGNEEEEAVYRSISEAFDQFTIEIQRTIDYITTVQKIGDIQKIITIGEVNKIKKLENYISRLFSLETTRFQPQKLIEFNEEIDFSAIDKMNYLEVCIGAALREVK